MKMTQKWLIYSATEKGGQSGVGIVLNKTAQDSLLDWEPVNDRILRIVLQTRQLTMTIVQCYAPTNDHEEEDKDQFYDDLNETMNKITSHDITMVMWDMNAKIEDDNTDVEDIMGKHSIGTINNNGERLLEFCVEKGLVSGGSLFLHKTIHKITWLSSDKLTRNQIDHICIKKKFRSSLPDVKVHRGANINSDHYLCIATIKLKLKRQKIQPKPRKLDVSKLKMEETKAQFNIEQRNRL